MTKVLSIQDISCFGQCSLTVALPILSHYGYETAILPSAVLSTHTGGFKNYTFLDLTEEMPKIVNHWLEEGITFDCIYTGYIGDVRQFDLILEIKEKLLNKNGLFIVDPAMADQGKLYRGLSKEIIEGMKKLISKADVIFPNITEASFLTGNEYLENYDEEYIKKLTKDLLKLGTKKVYLTGVMYDKKCIGAVCNDGNKFISYFGEYQKEYCHGTGDVFASVCVAKILSGLSDNDVLESAVNFVIKAIKKTAEDDNHNYGIKFEKVLQEEIK